LIAIESTNIEARRIDISWHPGMPIFASGPFLKAVGDDFGWLGGFDRKGELVCILPFTILKKYIVRMVRFRVETIQVKGNLSIAEEKSFLNSAAAYLEKAGADMIIPATTNAIFRTFPDGATAAPYGTYIIDLTQPEEVLWKKLSESHRRKVRLAMKQGVEVAEGVSYIDRAYDLVRDTFKRSRMGFMHRNDFKRYIEGLGENVKISVAIHDSKIHACIIVPFSEYSAYYVYGGSVTEPIAGATNLLHWEAIRSFRKIGVKRYDFVGVRINPEKGSKQEGLSVYKERFGGMLHRGYIWKKSFRPLKYTAYSLGVRLLRDGDIVDQERHKMVDYNPG
jgi:hypothetical protein